LDSRQEYESLETLIYILTFLVPNLCQQIPNISGFLTGNCEYFPN